MTKRRSRLGLDEEHSVWQKLFLFVSTLLIGPLIGLLLFMAVMGLQPPWKSLAVVLAEAFAAFWLASLVFIWWRPPWFRRIYLWVENKLILIVYVLIAGAVIVFAFGLV